MTVPRFLHPYARPAADDFTTIVRGSGALVWDSEGNRYIDALASLWFCGIGHGRAEVAEPVAAQLRELAAFHAFDRFTTPAADELCDRLASLAPMPDARVFLTSSGSEAVDSAIKLARAAFAASGSPERTLVVSRQHAYHGVTYGGLSAQGLPLSKQGFGPLLDDVVQVDHESTDEVGALFETHGDRVALVIAEPVIGAGGVIPPAPGYLERLRALCDAYGALLCFDEVICGFGRLGAWWGASRYGVVPDLVTFAKGVTSGYVPLGGVLVGPAARARLEADESFVLRHGHTYSGHAAACVAAMAVLDVLEAEALPARAAGIGDVLGGGLRSLVDDGVLAGSRGDHAIWAALLDEGVDAVRVRDELMGRGVIARALGASTIAFCPPLVIEESDLGRCVDALGESVIATRNG
jgi:adenosylmethionine-8-amino-7-oxononanoate aminotransferase